MNIAVVFGAIAGLSILLAVGLIALALARAARGRASRGLWTLALVTVALSILLNIVAAGLVYVPAQDRGVVLTIGSGGVREQALLPGLHWIVPFAETVVPYSISRQTYTMSIASAEGQVQGDDSIEARTADGQVVYVDASVIYTIDPTQVVKVHVNWQNTYPTGLVRPLTRGVIRDAISQYGIEEVVSSRRVEMINQVENELSDQFQKEGLILVDFVLRNLTFSAEYAASVEQKQIAEQLAQQAVFVVQQRKQEAEQARQVAQGKADAAAIAAEGDARALLITAKAQAEARLIQAQAEAEALERLAAAVRDNPEVLTLEYIQKLAPNITVMLLPSDNPFLFPLPQIQPQDSSAQPTIIEPAPAPQ